MLKASLEGIIMGMPTFSSVPSVLGNWTKNQEILFLLLLPFGQITAPFRASASILPGRENAEGGLFFSRNLTWFGALVINSSSLRSCG